jgi:hypothetical protein
LKEETALPSLRDLAQLRTLLPYAARLLPLLTGQPAPASPPPELGALNRHVGEMQTESRSLRSEVASQSEQLAQLTSQFNSRLDRLTALAEHGLEEQAGIAASLGRLAALLRIVSVAALLLLVAISVMCGLLLARVP